MRTSQHSYFPAVRKNERYNPFKVHASLEQNNLLTELSFLLEKEPMKSHKSFQGGFPYFFLWPSGPASNVLTLESIAATMDARQVGSVQIRCLLMFPSVSGLQKLSTHFEMQCVKSTLTKDSKDLNSSKDLSNALYFIQI